MKVYLMILLSLFLSASANAGETLEVFKCTEIHSLGRVGGPTEHVWEPTDPQGLQATIGLLTNVRNKAYVADIVRQSGDRRFSFTLNNCKGSVSDFAQKVNLTCDDSLSDRPAGFLKRLSVRNVGELLLATYSEYKDLVGLDGSSVLLCNQSH